MATPYDYNPLRQTQGSDPFQPDVPPPDQNQFQGNYGAPDFQGMSRDQFYMPQLGQGSGGGGGGGTQVNPVSAAMGQQGFIPGGYNQGASANDGSDTAEGFSSGNPDYAMGLNMNNMLGVAMNLGRLPGISIPAKGMLPGLPGLQPTGVTNYGTFNPPGTFDSFNPVDSFDMDIGGDTGGLSGVGMGDTQGPGTGASFGVDDDVGAFGMGVGPGGGSFSQPGVDFSEFAGMFGEDLGGGSFSDFTDFGDYSDTEGIGGSETEADV